MTLNRSDSGRGRKQQAEVWERPFDTSMQELQDEADLRNSDDVELGAEEKKSGPVSQQDYLLFGVVVGDQRLPWSSHLLCRRKLLGQN